MGENEKHGSPGALNFIHLQKVDHNSVYKWLIYPPRQAKIPKTTKSFNCYKDKMGRKKIVTKNVTASNRQQEGIVAKW